MISAEPATNPVAPLPGGTAPFVAAGPELLGELLELLSELDQLREEAEAIDFPREAERGLKLFRKFAGRIEEFGRRCDQTGRSEKLLEIHREFEVLTDGLMDGLPPSGSQGRNGGGTGPDRRDIARALELFHDLMFRNFEFFTTRFADRKLARFWVDSAATFCVEVRRVLRSYRLAEGPKPRPTEGVPRCPTTKLSSSSTIRRPSSRS